MRSTWSLGLGGGLDGALGEEPHAGRSAVATTSAPSARNRSCERTWHGSKNEKGRLDLSNRPSRLPGSNSPPKKTSCGVGSCEVAELVHATHAAGAAVARTGRFLLL